MHVWRRSTGRANRTASLAGRVPLSPRTPCLRDTALPLWLLNRTTGHHHHLTTTTTVSSAPSERPLHHGSGCRQRPCWRNSWLIWHQRVGALGCPPSAAQPHALPRPHPFCRCPRSEPCRRRSTCPPRYRGVLRSTPDRSGQRLSLGAGSTVACTRTAGPSRGAVATALFLPAALTDTVPFPVALTTATPPYAFPDTNGDPGIRSGRKCEYRCHCRHEHYSSRPKTPQVPSGPDDSRGA